MALGAGITLDDILKIRIEDPDLSWIGRPYVYTNCIQHSICEAMLPNKLPCNE